MSEQSSVKGEVIASIAGVGHSALRQEPYKSLLEDCKTAPNTFIFIRAVSKVVDHKTSRREAIEVDGEYIDGEAEKARKTKLEADKLQDEKNLRRQKWAPIAEMDSEWMRQLRHILEITQETVDEIKSRVELTAQEEEEIDVTLANGLNRIAEQ